MPLDQALAARVELAAAGNTVFTRRIVFGLHRGDSWVSKAIQWQTRSDYSHVSVVQPDGTLLEALQGEGVTARRVLVEVREPVDLVAVNCTPEQFQAATDFLCEQMGKGYDYTMVARFVTRQQESRKTSGKWFCSELAFAAAKEAGVQLLRSTEPWEVSPGLFARSPLVVSIDRSAFERKAALVRVAAIPGLSGFSTRLRSPAVPS